MYVCSYIFCLRVYLRAWPCIRLYFYDFYLFLLHSNDSVIIFSPSSNRLLSPFLCLIKLPSAYLFVGENRVYCVDMSRSIWRVNSSVSVAHAHWLFLTDFIFEMLLARQKASINRPSRKNTPPYSHVWIWYTNNTTNKTENLTNFQHRLTKSQKQPVFFTWKESKASNF